MLKRAAEMGLDLEFFEAVNGRNLSSDQMALYDSKKRCQFFGRDLTLGEIGCLLSHRGIYEKMAQENIPVAIILGVYGVFPLMKEFEPDRKKEQ